LMRWISSSVVFYGHTAYRDFQRSTGSYVELRARHFITRFV